MNDNCHQYNILHIQHLWRAANKEINEDCSLTVAIDPSNLSRYMVGKNLKKAPTTYINSFSLSTVNDVIETCYYAGTSKIRRFY